MRMLSVASLLVATSGSALAADLIVDGTTVTLGGTQRFDHIHVINGGKIVVTPFDGTDKVNTGNLVLVSPEIIVDATSTIDATGTGYFTAQCANGTGPGGGIGGCAVRDSGGGGAHFGNGGRGTKDCNSTCGTNNAVCEFPAEFEENCGNTLAADGKSCTNESNCWTCGGGNPDNGTSYRHNIYDIEFGSSGGDKGCRDNDGFGAQPAVGGAGGGRVVLAAVTGAQDGSIQIAGKILAPGHRGCGTGNDSGGGGAGGSILIEGDNVQVDATAIVNAAGGGGGDQQVNPACPPPDQQGGTCDDCGGGGGGGIISVLSRSKSLDYRAQFLVDGAVGGVCPICTGEAGGGAGELQLDGAYTGELCDGYDNDFDGTIDDNLPMLPCGLPSCVAGEPQECPPDPTCIGPVTDTRARMAVIVDTSGSMLLDPAGLPTFGDGSAGHVGVDINSDGTAGNDSKLFIAKQSLTDIISAYPEIDFALARYHQDEGVNRSCQVASWFECHGICCSYDNPLNNTPPAASPACSLNTGATGTVAVDTTSPGDECVNYAGSCGPPRRGADVLVGFGKPIDQYLMWLDDKETNFKSDATPGDFCDFLGGGDCELRATGPTPLQNALDDVHDFIGDVKSCDGAAACRRYSIVLLTDGAEDCLGDPIAAAKDLHDNESIDTFVIGFSVQPTEETELNAIAQAGSGGTSNAFFVTDQSALENAFAQIVASSVVFEKCNGVDDNCNGIIDEGFDVGAACDDGGKGACKGTGMKVCNATHDGTTCQITMPGQPPGSEICNGIDDNCNGEIDEGLTCNNCVPTGPEVCDGVDNDCNGLVDETNPNLGMPCGVSSTPPCSLGAWQCIAGQLVCVGERDPLPEMCNGIDDNCDGIPDNVAPCPGVNACIDGGCRIPCDPTQEFGCPSGFECDSEPPLGSFCVPSPCAQCKPNEVCTNDVCVDPCAGITCPTNQTCSFGGCYTCDVLGCTPGDVCFGSVCVPDPCVGVTCSGGESCVDGTCVAPCDDESCAPGQTCGADGMCHDDPCAGILCPGEDICSGGACVANPCLMTTCPAGQVCVDAACTDNPCPKVTCAVGRECEVGSDGQPRCVSIVPPPKPVKVYATGGGGCACSTGGSSSSSPSWPPLLLLGVGLVAFRRRRSR